MLSERVAVNLLSHDKIGSTILVALVAHHAPNITARSGFSADKYLLFRVFTR